MIGLFTLFTTGASVLLVSQSVIADNTLHLLSRQANTFDPSSLPSQCQQTKCKAFIQLVQSCTELSCLCTNAVYSEMKTCLQCAVDVANPTAFNATSAQLATSALANACKAGGFPISGVSDTSGLSGSTPGSTTGSASASGSTTGSASASKATTAVGTKSSGTLVGVSIGFLGAVVGLAMAGLSL